MTSPTSTRYIVLTASFDMNQQGTQLGWTFASSLTGFGDNATPMSPPTSGVNAGAIVLLRGDQIQLRVIAYSPANTNPPKIGLQDVTLSSRPHNVNSGRLLALPLAATPLANDTPSWTWSSAGFVKAPVQPAGQTVFIHNDIASVPQTRLNGVWEFSMMLCACTEVNGVATAYRVFTFDPEVQVGDGSAGRGH